MLFFCIFVIVFTKKYNDMDNRISFSLNEADRKEIDNVNKTE
jgi:hypothetical protein